MESPQFSKGSGLDDKSQGHPDVTKGVTEGHLGKPRGLGNAYSGTLVTGMPSLDSKTDFQSFEDTKFQAKDLAIFEFEAWNWGCSTGSGGAEREPSRKEEKSWASSCPAHGDSDS